MADSKSQLDPKVKAPFTDTEVAVLLEHIDDKLAFIVEGHRTLVEGQQGLSARFGTVEQKIDVLTDTMGEVKVELTEVNDKLDHKVDRSEFTRLSSRVSVLETAK